VVALLGARRGAPAIDDGGGFLALSNVGADSFGVAISQPGAFGIATRELCGPKQEHVCALIRFACGAKWQTWGHCVGAFRVPRRAPRHHAAFKKTRDLGGDMCGRVLRAAGCADLSGHGNYLRAAARIARPRKLSWK